MKQRYAPRKRATKSDIEFKKFKQPHVIYGMVAGGKIIYVGCTSDFEKRKLALKNTWQHPTIKWSRVSFKILARVNGRVGALEKETELILKHLKSNPGLLNKNKVEPSGDLVRVSGRIPVEIYEPFRLKLFQLRITFQTWLVQKINKEIGIK